MLKSYSPTVGKRERRSVMNCGLDNNEHIKREKEREDSWEHLMIRAMVYTWAEKKTACAMRAQLLH